MKLFKRQGSENRPVEKESQISSSPLWRNESGLLSLWLWLVQFCIEACKELFSDSFSVFAKSSPRPSLELKLSLVAKENFQKTTSGNLWVKYSLFSPHKWAVSQVLTTIRFLQQVHNSEVQGCLSTVFCSDFHTTQSGKVGDTFADFAVMWTSHDPNDNLKKLHVRL